MKPFFFSMFMMLAGLQASAEDTTLHIKTQLEGVGDTLEVKIDDMLIPYIGSAGVFDFDFPLDEATYITIATPATFRGEELQYANLPAVLGETVEIKGSLTNGYTISGSRFYQDLNTIYNEIDQAMLPFNQLKMELNQQAAAGANQDSIMQIYNEREPEMQKQQDEALLDIVRRHADSEAVTVRVGHVL